jgi:hypothetical protein
VPPNTTDAQVDAARAALKQAVETPASSRTPAQVQKYQLKLNQI